MEDYLDEEESALYSVYLEREGEPLYIGDIPGLEEQMEHPAAATDCRSQASKARHV